jgi:hypothetical protein
MPALPASGRDKNNSFLRLATSVRCAANVSVVVVSTSEPVMAPGDTEVLSACIQRNSETTGSEVDTAEAMPTKKKGVWTAREGTLAVRALECRRDVRSRLVGHPKDPRPRQSMTMDALRGRNAEAFAGMGALMPARADWG